MVVFIVSFLFFSSCVSSLSVYFHSELQGTGHERSLLERTVLSSGKVHRLIEQYRMHPSICSLISDLFYHSMLKTPPLVAEERLSVNENPLQWIESSGSESRAGPSSKSYINVSQIQDSVKMCYYLRTKYPDSTIAVLTLYKDQLLEIMKVMPAEWNVEVLTVDVRID